MKSRSQTPEQHWLLAVHSAPALPHVPPLDEPELPPLDDEPDVELPPELELLPDEVELPPDELEVAVKWAGVHKFQAVATQNLPLLVPLKLVISWQTQLPLVLHLSPTFFGVWNREQLTTQTQSWLSLNVTQ